MSEVSEIARREAMVAEAELTDAEAERTQELVEEGKTLEDAIAEVVAARHGHEGGRLATASGRTSAPCSD